VRQPEEEKSTVGWISTTHIANRAQSFLQHVSAKVDGMIRFACWRILRPQIALSSGSVSISSDSDWLVANEIFVERDYDEPILQVFSSQRTHAIRIFDLGANVGFFSLRCIDLYLQANIQAGLELVAIEGARSLFPDLERRLATYSTERPHINLTVKSGLVGLRAGKAMFHPSILNSCTASVARNNHISKTRLRASYAEECSYVDLEELIPPDAVVDLIKCDIEGSELDFLENYSSLLRRTRIIAIEFHPYHCDVLACRNLLDGYGFLRQRIIKNQTTHSLEIYQKRAS
jgi:FkbM family methyltransferase